MKELQEHLEAENYFSVRHVFSWIVRSEHLCEIKVLVMFSDIVQDPASRAQGWTGGENQTLFRTWERL